MPHEESPDLREGRGSVGSGRVSGSLCRESAERGESRIDRTVEAAVPLHHHGTGRVELANDTPVTGPEVGSRVRNELDHGTDAHTGGDPRGEQTSTCRIHARS